MKIHDDASQGDIEGVKRELRRGAKVDVRNEQDMTALAISARSPDAGVEMLRVLIHAGADVNAAVDDGKTFSVGLAADSGDLAKLRCLLDAGANVNAASEQGYTPLINVLYHLQDAQRLLPVVDMLVKNGADLDAVTSYGESPLTTAAMQGRFDVVKYLIGAGAKTDRLNWTPAMMAICTGTANELQQIIEGGGDLEGRDCFGRTAWLLCATVGDVEKAQLVLSHGADLEERGRMGDTALANCVGRGHVIMTDWLIEAGADVDTADDAGNSPLMIAAQTGQAECLKLLLDAGADPRSKNTYNETAMSMASSESVIRQLAQAGEDLADISQEMRRLLTRMGGSDKLEVTREQYLSGRYRRFGRANPEVMKITFWKEMVRTGINAYQAKMQFDDTGNYSNPIWCFDRFGTSFTELPGGRFVQIGGEHEDYYDPDFCIYNDVFVHDGSGNLEILGYPEDVFPPTDFHSATLVDGVIYLVGRLGYHGTREFGTTPVYRLNCRNWSIERVQTFGDSPGWIFEHKATSDGSAGIIITGGKVCRAVDGKEQHIQNEERFRLDVTNMVWSRMGRAEGVRAF